MTAEEEQEAIVRARLRALALVSAILGVVMLALSFVTLEITDTYGSRNVRAMDFAHRLWVFLALLPSAWVMRTPTRRLVLAWAVWFLASVGALEWLADPPQQGWFGTVDPWWVQPLLAMMMIGLAAIIAVIMPIIRLSNRELAGLPRARIHRDR